MTFLITGIRRSTNMEFGRAIRECNLSYALSSRNITWRWFQLRSWRQRTWANPSQFDPKSYWRHIRIWCSFLIFRNSPRNYHSCRGLLCKHWSGLCECRIRGWNLLVWWNHGTKQSFVERKAERHWDWYSKHSTQCHWVAVFLFIPSLSDSGAPSSLFTQRFFWRFRLE